MDFDKDIQFTGLTVKARKLIKKRVAGLWPPKWTRIKVEVPLELKSNLADINNWIDENATGRYNLGVLDYYHYERRARETTASSFILHVVFENANDALVFKLTDIRTIVEDAKVIKND